MRLGRKQMVLLVLVAILIATVALALRRPPVPVRAAEARRELVVNTVSTNGTAEPVRGFQAYAPAAGVVRRVAVREGDRVRPGDLLLQLEDSDARARAARALSQLRAAEASLAAVQSGGTREEVLTLESEREQARREQDAAQNALAAVRRLAERGAASAGEVRAAEERLARAQSSLALLEQRRGQRYSPAEIARAEAQVAEARAAHEAAQSVLRESTVRSGVAGTVYLLPVREGQFVPSGQLLVQVADLSEMQVRAFVDEPEIGRLSEGQPVRITWDAQPGIVWDGSIARLPSAVIQRGTRTVGELIIRVDNHEKLLLPNTNVSVQVTIGRHENALTVPREAIHQDESGRYVFIIENDRLVRQDVRTAASNLTRIQVVEGLREGASIALGAANMQPLRAGQGVRVVGQ